MSEQDPVAALHLHSNSVAQLVYLDQNAWVTLARGYWDRGRHPREYAALTKLDTMVRSGAITVPLTFTNIYETLKVNVFHRRENLALVQSKISGGRVFRGRRQILIETLTAQIAQRSGCLHREPPQDWFLSDFWVEAVSDYFPEFYGFEASDHLTYMTQQNPGYALFDYLAFSREKIRLEAVRRFSASSGDLIARLEARRTLVAGEPIAVRKRAYGAAMIINELDFILKSGEHLGLNWSTVRDIGPLLRSIIVDVPPLKVERELAVRLEDQGRAIAENDLRDMLSFITVLPFADVVVAERQFVNLSRQARLDQRYGTKLMTSIFDLLEDESQPL